MLARLRRFPLVRRWPASRFNLAVICLWFLATRAVAMGATHLGAAMMSEKKHLEWDWVPEKSDLFLGPAPNRFIAPTVRWDANFYIALARLGYQPTRPGSQPFHVAFFPLYPLTIGLVTGLAGDPFVSAFLISNLACLLAALVMLRLGAIGTCPRDGLRASLLLLASPGSHFLSYPYPEALFLLLISLAFLAIACDRPVLAVLPGALASAARSAGVVVALALVVTAWQRRRHFGQMLIRLAAATMSLAGVASFAIFCRARFGDPLAFAHIQQDYGRSLTLAGPFLALVSFTVDPDYFIVTFAAIAGCFWMVRRTTALLSASAWFLLLLPMATGTLKAMIRYQSTNAPLFVGVARIWRGRAFDAVVLACTLVMALEAYLFGMGIGHY